MVTTEWAQDYAIEAMPTVYSGCTYRSRLEARWAAFFDAAFWRHVYEPALEDGWLPDFRLERDVLVEIKPTERHDPREKMKRAIGDKPVHLLLLNRPIAEHGWVSSEEPSGPIGEVWFHGDSGWRDAFVGRTTSGFDIFAERVSRWLLSGKDRGYRLPERAQAKLVADWWDKAGLHLIDADLIAWWPQR